MGCTDCPFPVLCNYLFGTSPRKKHLTKRKYERIWKERPDYRLLWKSQAEGQATGQQAPVKRWNCAHLGDVIDRLGCGRCNTRWRRGCAIHGETTLTRCRTCPDFRPAGDVPKLADPALPRPGDPRCGVVIGCYRWPKLAELQIRLIRHLCGPVPILLSDDATPGKEADFRRLTETYPDVHYQRSRRRIGHAGGDLQAFRRGVAWAARQGLEVLGKLSQRMLVLRPYWLQDGALELLASGRSLASQPCTEGLTRWPVRTELCLLDVAWWQQPEVLGRLPPGAIRAGAEAILGAVAGPLHRWSIMGEDRCIPNVNYIWHTANRDADYRELARQYGLELDADFSAGPSHLIAGHKGG